jgi:hypothetical protein
MFFGSFAILFSFLSLQKKQLHTLVDFATAASHNGCLHNCVHALILFHDFFSMKDESNTRSNVLCHFYWFSYDENACISTLFCDAALQNPPLCSSTLGNGSPCSGFFRLAHCLLPSSLVSLLPNNQVSARRIKETCFPEVW